MESVDAAKAVELDRCSSLGADSSTDVDMAASAWSDCMFTTRDDDMLAVSDIFSTSLRAMADLDPQNLSSSSSSSTLSASVLPPSSPHVSAPPLSSDEETIQTCPSSEPSGSSATLPNTDQGSWVKSENLDQTIENLDCAFTSSKELSDQNNSSVLSTFEDEFVCGALPTSQLPQDDYNIEGLLQLRSEDLCRLDFPPLMSVCNAGCEDYSQIMDAWPSTSSRPLLTVEIPSSNPEDSPESLSQVFAQWLKSNGDCISVADLKRIKLKTSTIESATQRLGGGKRGMSYLLKLILIWIQNHHLPRKRQRSDVDLGSPGFDSRLLNNGLCTPSSIEDGIENACRKKGGFEGMFSRGCDQGNGVAADNAMALQGTSEPNLSGDTSASIYSTNLVSSMGSSYDAQLALQTNNGGGTFGRMDANLSADLNSLTMRQPKGSSSPANVNASLQYNHLSQASNFPLLIHPLSDDRLWHTSTGQVSPMSAALQDRNAHSFAGTTPYVRPSNSLNVAPSTPAATTRAARKSRMARQRWSMRHARIWPSAGTNQLPWSSQVSGASFQNMSFPSQGSNRLLTSIGDAKQSKKPNRNLRLLLQKELKQSDVGNLGRIVLPKKEAESNLPHLAIRDGINLVVEDWSTFKVWNMRYRFWPNNKSRMYLLENTGDFVKLHRMKESDQLMLYADTATGKYVIRGIKVPRQDTSSTVTDKSSSSSCRSASTGAGGPQKAAPSAAAANTSEAPKRHEEVDGLLEADSSRNGSPSNSSSSISEALESEDGCLLDEFMNTLYDDDEDELKTKPFPRLLSSELSVPDDLQDLVKEI